MRILILCAKHPPLDKRMHQKFALSAVKLGDEVFYISPNADCVTVEGVKISGFPQKKGMVGRLVSLWELYKQGRSVAADWIFAPEPDSLLVAWLLKRRMGTRIVFDSHEYYYKSNRSRVQIFNRIFEMVLGLYFKIVLPRCDAVFAVTETMKAYYGKIAGRVLFIPNTTSPVKINAAQSHYYVYSGIIYSEQEIVELATLMSQRKAGFNVVVLGAFNRGESYRNKFDALADSLRRVDPDNKVQLLEWVSKAEADEWIEKSLGGLLFYSRDDYNQYYGLANKVFDYMAYGKPIIANEGYETGRIISTYHCGATYESGNTEQLYSLLERIHEDARYRDEISQNAYNLIAGPYNWSVFEERVHNLIHGDNQLLK